MAYVAPYVDSTGLHIPTYQDILEDMIASARAIYGEDIYLENDSADYQLISTFALKQYDILQAVQYAYNSRSPVDAVGVALDTVLKLNGIVRKAASHSTCQVKLTGIAYTQILNGAIKDANDTKWLLPAVVIIPQSGEVTVTATCEIPGAITVAIGDLNKIVTPTYGWTAVTNEVIAVTGSVQESDESLRRRQSVSVAIPSQTMLEGTLASIRAVEDVKRCAVYENDTNSANVSPANPYGLPPHSITCVVEGGDDYEIANAILYHKGIGCYTNGDTTVEVLGRNDYVNHVRFFRPNYVDVHVKVKLKPYVGFISSAATDVQAAIDEYLQSLTIGSDVSISTLVTVAMQCNDDLNCPSFGVKSIAIGTSAASASAADIVIDYNQIPNSLLENIIVEVEQ